MYLPPQVLHQAKTERYHPGIEFLSGWHVRHSENYWSSEATMVGYVNKVLLPFIQTREKLCDCMCHTPLLRYLMSFKGQQTPTLLGLLERNSIYHITVPAYCTDKLRPLEWSVNNPFKDEMKQHCQTWYAEEVGKQLGNGIATQDVKIDTCSSILHACIIIHVSTKATTTALLTVSLWKILPDSL